MRVPRSENAEPTVPAAVPDEGIPTTARPRIAVYSENPEGQLPIKKAIIPDGIPSSALQVIVPLLLIPVIFCPEGQL